MKMSVADKNRGIDIGADSDAKGAIFNPIKTKRAFDEISNEIKRLIFKGILKPGDRLPSETELANRFNVGRQTIREALRLLELSGFISMQKGGAGGPLIVDTILNTITNSFLDTFQMGKISVDEHTKARVEIEKMVLNYVLTNIEESDVRCLQQNIDCARAKLDNEMQAFEENVEFHRLLAKASKNHVFLVVMESIMAVVSHIRSLLGMDLELTRKVVNEHQEIVNAIVAKNHSGALELLEAHLMHVGRRYKAFLNQTTDSVGEGLYKRRS
jgi:GntR family transcriptional regulator, transcriptional repressor for pyruvate dehydrogenase complex